MNRTILLALLLSAATVAADGLDDWIEAPKGIFISEVTALPEGFGVRFETDLPPPYRVGVHVPEEAGLAARAWPVAWTDTSDTYAVVTGKFLDVALFVQVYKPGPTTTPPWTHCVSASDWADYVSRIRSRPPRTVSAPSYYDNPTDCDLRGVDSERFMLLDDDIWGCFIRTNATELTLQVDEVRRIPGPEYELVTNVTPVHVTGLDPSAGGHGYRVTVCTRGDARDLQVQNAYSVRTNMSQEVLVKRGWKSLSSNGRWKFTTDWEGTRVFVPCTNAVPYKIYGEGL